MEVACSYSSAPDSDNDANNNDDNNNNDDGNKDDESCSPLSADHFQVYAIIL